jgi:hypothetical protein
MPKYIITPDTIKQSAAKTSFEVTFIDEINGKANVTCNHEIESLDEAVINVQLSLSAIEFENRLNIQPIDSENLATGVEVKAEVQEISELPIEPII